MLVEVLEAVVSVRHWFNSIMGIDESLIDTFSSIASFKASSSKADGRPKAIVRLKARIARRR